MGATRRSRAVLALLAVVLLPGLAEGSKPLRRSITARFWEQTLADRQLRVDLPDRWIAPGSLVATIDAETLRAGIDYELEPNEGVLRLKEPRPQVTVRFEYRVVPLAIGRVFQDPIPADTADAGRTPIPPSKSRLRPVISQSRLELRGSKTISLEVGSSQDLTVRQSLDVTLGGEIVSGVTVRGVLSDRQTPLQPEGRTTELSDLDRIYLQVDGQGASMTLGDFQLKGPPGLFTGYERQLEGILLYARRGTAHLKLAAAAVPGEYLSVEFVGEEGKQGPYDLRPRNAPLDAVILAGSETVWLDGERLVRGEDRDYAIDYAAATIRFTARRVIGNASRITVDMLISSQPYRRNAYATEIGWGAASREKCTGFGLRATLLAERDDRNRPVGGSLTETEKEALQAAGDSLTIDLASGIDCAEAGHGDYRWVEADSLERPFFRYVGMDAGGTCRVRFDDVGERRGDYADSSLADGTKVFRYVGYRQGRYLPGRAVPRPLRRDLLDLAGAWGGPSGLRAEVEAAGSVDDPNTLSSLHDKDRLGGALRLLVAREPMPLQLGSRRLGRWGFTLEGRDLEERFRPVTRLDPSWYGYDWGVDAARLQKGDRRRSAQLHHEPGWGFAVTGTYETLSNRRDLDGKRTRLKVGRTGKLQGSVERLRATTEDRSGEQEERGERAIDEGRLGVRLTSIEGGLRLRRERTAQGEGETKRGSGFDEWSATAAYLRQPGNARFEVARTERRDRLSSATDWTRTDHTRTWEVRTVWSPPGRQLEGHYTRRELFRQEGDDVRSDLASLLWSQNVAEGRFGHQLRAELNTAEQEDRVKAIEYVGVDRGRYDSLGVYVGTGDYDLVLLATGSTTRQRRFEASWRVDVAPGRGATQPAERLLGHLWQSSQWLLYATFSARTTGSAAEFWSSLPRLLLAEQEGVPLSSHNIRAEASALPGARWASPQVKMRRQRSREHLYENVQTRRSQDLWSLSLRSMPAKGWSMEQEMQAEREEEITALLDGSRASGSLGWRSLHVRLGGRWRPEAAWTARLDVTTRTRERIPNKERYEIFKIQPGLQWVGALRARVDLAATRTWVDRPVSRILGLENAGWEARATFSARLRGSLDASVIGEFDAPDRSRARTNVRAELKALF